MHIKLPQKWSLSQIPWGGFIGVNDKTGTITGLLARLLQRGGNLRKIQKEKNFNTPGKLPNAVTIGNIKSRCKTEWLRFYFLIEITMFAPFILSMGPISL